MKLQLHQDFDTYIEGVLAPCQVFEQLPQQMVCRERGCRWYLVGSEVLPFPLIGSQWLLFYPGGPWKVTVISGWALDRTACSTL